MNFSTVYGGHWMGGFVGLFYKRQDWWRNTKGTAGAGGSVEPRGTDNGFARLPDPWVQHMVSKDLKGQGLGSKLSKKNTGTQMRVECLGSENPHERPLASDLGIVLRARGPNQLFEDIAATTFSLLTDLDNIEPREARVIQVRGRDHGELLVRWLRELLTPQDGATYLYRKFKVEPLSADRLASIAWGERIDPRRHRLYRGVTMLTPHDALVSESPEGWSARVIFEE